jgi:hypothetical protein
VASIWNHAVRALNWVQCSISSELLFVRIAGGSSRVGRCGNYNAEPSHTYDTYQTIIFWRCSHFYVVRRFNLRTFHAFSISC